MEANMQEIKSGKCDDVVSRETVEDIRRALLFWADNFMSTERINNTFNRFLEEGSDKGLKVNADRVNADRIYRGIGINC